MTDNFHDKTKKKTPKKQKTNSKQKQRKFIKIA